MGAEIQPAEAELDQRQTEAVQAGNTTHITVVDDSGMTVSMTQTLTSFWGGDQSEYVAGFFLNDQLNRFAALDTEQNQPAPGRKSVSWSAPVLLLDDQGRPVLGIGSPGGGHQIPNILASTVLPWALSGASLEQAVTGPRHSLQGSTLALETEPAAEVRQLAEDQGWEIQVTTRNDAVFGSVQALEIDYEAGTVTGAPDPRRDGDVEIIDGDSTGAG
ncbi:gamma-glutamyltransferase [Auritidibacter ignavus]|uniref:gamma-glutamyltransferase n=1 Tax=Auritidibacter ignavus TaxID=678932 RepID=UPI003133AB10